MNQFTNQLFALLMVCCSFAVTTQVQAQCAAGETEYVVDVTPLSFPEEISWTLVDDATGTVVAEQVCGSYTLSGPTSDTVCLTTGSAYTLNLIDDWGDGWNGGTYSLTDASCGAVSSGEPNNLLAGDGTADCALAGGDVEESYSFVSGGPYMGCTDPTAINFDACATVDDGSCVYPAANDECVDATIVPVGSCVTGTNIGATYSAAAGPVDPSCAGISADGTVLDIWFTTIVPASGNLQVDLPTVPGITSTLEFYGGTCASLINLTSTLGTPCINYGPGGFAVLGGLTPGAQIWIRYWDFGNDDFGTYEVCISEPVSGCTDVCSANYDSLAVIDDGSCSGGPVGAGDDACASAVSIPGPGTYEHYNVFATASDTVDITSCALNDIIDVWYSYAVPTGLDTLKVYTCGNSYDTGLSFWDACGGAEIACNDDGSFGTAGSAGSTCDGSIFASMITLSDSALDAVEGTTILIRVAGYNGSVGCGDLIIDEVAGMSACDASVAPANFAATVTASTVTFTWDAVPGSIGCQLGAGPSGAGFPITRNFLGAGLTTSGPIPLSIIPSGNYQARVRCACEITPVPVATPFSNAAQFTVPSPRVGQFATVSISPNPATSIINLTYTGAADEQVRFSIVNILGSELASKTTDLNEGLNNLSFDVSELESGLYFINIVNGETSFSEQFEVIK